VPRVTATETGAALRVLIRDLKRALAVARATGDAQQRAAEQDGAGVSVGGLRRRDAGARVERMTSREVAADWGTHQRRVARDGLVPPRSRAVRPHAARLVHPEWREAAVS
jgi:hypothetical protein